VAVAIASDLSKHVAGAPLLRGVSFKLERRDRLALSGRNGTGKTTLLRMLAGETPIDGGELSISSYVLARLRGVPLIALPLILGIGVDYGVHIVHEYREQNGPYRMSPGTAVAVLVDALTTLVGFGSLMIAYPTFGLPFACWLLMGYYRSIPKDLEEAAMLDGANHFQCFVQIVLPLTLPALLAVALLARPPDFRVPADYAGVALVCAGSVAYALSFAG